MSYYNYRMVKKDGAYSVMEVWYASGARPESSVPVRISEPIHEYLLDVRCEKCATEDEKDAAARFMIIKQLTDIIRDLSNDAAPLLHED